MANLFQMYQQNGCRTGFWVKRFTWANSVALIKKVAGLVEGELPGAPPRYGQPGKRNAEVLCDVFDVRTGVLKDSDVSLPHPRTSSYRVVECPDWAHGIAHTEGNA